MFAQIQNPENEEANKLKYVSTYKMGQIGITKLIEEPNKASINIDKNLHQSQEIIGANNTNNTNSNTNTNTCKGIDNITNQKKLINNHSTSNKSIHKQPHSNLNLKNNKKSNSKSNQKINIIKKKEINSPPEIFKLNKNHFSNTTNNLWLYMNNRTNKNKYNKNKISFKITYSKKKIKSKSNNGKMASESGNSKYILSSRAPSSIKRNKKANQLLDFIMEEKNINSFKSDMSNLYLKTSNNMSCCDLNKNGKKKITKEKTNKELIGDSKYQMTEINNYLKVRKRDEVQNSKIKDEPTKLLSSCIFSTELSEKNNTNARLSQGIFTEENIIGKPSVKLILKEEKESNRVFTENNQNILNLKYKKNIISNKRKNLSYKDLYNNHLSSKTYSHMKDKEKKNDKNIKKTEKADGNIKNSKKKNNNKNKYSYKTRKNFSMSNSKKQMIKNNKNKDENKNLTNIYSSFVKYKKKKKNIDSKKNIVNNNNNIIKNEINEDNKNIKFGCPEESHFFMVKITHNYIFANSNF